MTELRLPYPASAMAGQHRLTVDDILLLRRETFPSGLTSPRDARYLLALHRSDSEKCPEWHDWFVEMMTAYIVCHSWPQNSLDELNAEWTLAVLSTDGIVNSEAELEVVLHAMEMAASVPDILSVFALDQLRQALETGKGAYARMREKRRGVSERDIEYIYRILRGACSRGKILLSAREAGVLDRIDALTRGRANHPAWQELMTSIAFRLPDGVTTAVPWLRMMFDGVSLEDAA